MAPEQGQSQSQDEQTKQSQGQSQTEPDGQTQNHSRQDVRADDIARADDLALADDLAQGSHAGAARSASPMAQTTRLEVVLQRDGRRAVLLLPPAAAAAAVGLDSSTRGGTGGPGGVRSAGAPCVGDAVSAACRKFRLAGRAARGARLVCSGAELADVSASLPAASTSGGIHTASAVLLLPGEVYGGPGPEAFAAAYDAAARVSILDGMGLSAAAAVWIDRESVAQLHQLVRGAPPGTVLRAVGLPDLHSGPTGVAVHATAPMPRLPGYDIGCGIALFATRVDARMARDGVARRMARVDMDIGEDSNDPYFGTIGGGNHFCELLRVDPDVPLSAQVAALVDPSRALLLVHSGSRGHGARAFEKFADGADTERYMKEHRRLVEWAQRNRVEIARRFLSQFSGAQNREPNVAADGVADAAQHVGDGGNGGGDGGGAGGGDDGGGSSYGGDGSSGGDNGCDGGAIGSDVCGGGGGDSSGGCGSAESAVAGMGCPTPLVDIAHNWIEELSDGTFLHRKGAAPSPAGGLSLLPGSRATASYVLECRGSHARDLCSLAHGAGRQLSRADARRRGAAGRPGGGGSGGDLTRGGTVVCENRDLLAEEGAHAYKSVEAVVACMVERGMCAVGARLLPMATYKTRCREGSA